MGKPEIALDPPAPTAKAVLVHRKKLEIERDALRTGAAELALKSAQGDADAQAALRAIPAKQTGLQFEIDQNHAAYVLAVKQDSDAESAWRGSLQTMDPEDLIAGIGKEMCCGLCQPGSFCVITGGYAYAGAQCGHPIRELHAVFGRDPTGDRKFRYAHNPRAARVFEAARLKLKVPTR
jgi:hypothetical protein